MTTDILRRDLAPIPDAAWKRIEAEAHASLSVHLSTRRFVDVTEPAGFERSAVSLGRMDMGEKEIATGVSYGVRRVQPLVELRAAFEVDVWELDNIERGAEDIDFGGLEEAARHIADAENRIVLDGFAPGGITGILPALDHDAVALGTDPSGYPERIAGGILTLRDAGVDGPYALVVSSALFKGLAAVQAGEYPLRKRVEELIGGPLLPCHGVSGGLLVSLRGGDFRLTLGQDLAIGYETHDARTVRLYFTESLTFRVLDGAAAVPLTLG